MLAGKYSILYFFIFAFFSPIVVTGQSTDIAGPVGSGQFGYYVKVVANGNYVVVDPYYDEGVTADVGAIYLYNGITHALISTLKGSNTNDRIGIQGITLLTNGNFVVLSNTWNGNRGAATWVNGSTGLSGTVSSSNSFTGNIANDNVGIYLTALTNGNYVIVSPFCSNGAITSAGAITLGNGITGITGTVSSSNSLVGSVVNDRVGIHNSFQGIYALDNGNYVVCSSNWNGNRGAVTLGNGSTGVTGIVSSGNSLVGSTVNDRVGDYGIVKLTNSNYVISSPYWDNVAITDAGAATWCSGTVATTGFISSSNALVGSKANDWVGYGALQGNNYIIPLSNGNYVVGSPYWHNGAAAQVGAATWADGNTGITGIISSSNSLIGNAANAFGAYRGITALTNGNYVVCSEFGGNGAATFCNGLAGTSGTITISNSLYGAISSDAIGSNGATALTNGNYVVGSGFSGKGAATWGNGITGIIGMVSSSNSLVGSAVGHGVAAFITALTNGNYVVSSPAWDNGATLNVGAATWGDGTNGTTGIVTTTNSLVGTFANNSVANGGVKALKNGNYVVQSYLWDNGALTDVGAATWGNGTTGTTGNVSSSNSLIGSTASDNIGGDIITLSNGNYLVRCTNWDNGAATNAGAVTWGPGNMGVSGIISNTNSLIGTTANDGIGNSPGNTGPEFENKYYLLNSPSWDNGALVNAGAATFGSTITGVTGNITSCNSVIASTAFSSTNWVTDYNSTYDYFVVGRLSSNLVTIYRPSGMTLAIHLDYSSPNLNGIGSTPVITTGGCRIIATLKANGVSPINGVVNSRIWVESTVPTYAGLPYVARHYEIYPAANGATATGKVTLYFTQQEFTDFNNHGFSQLDLPSGPIDAVGKANLRIGKFSGTSGNGTGFPGTYSNPAEVINPADTDIMWNAVLNRWEVSFDVTGFGGFVVQTEIFPLPVNLVSFTGILNQNNMTLLTWKVENQSGIKEYLVEKSIDGRNFQSIGFVIANNNNDFTYHFVDTQSLSGKVFYRIQLVGQINTSYSNTIRLSNVKKNDIIIYPMPVTDAFTILTSDKTLLGSSARLVDAAGSLVKQFIISSLPAKIFVPDLSKGFYFLQLNNGNILKIIKQ